MNNENPNQTGSATAGGYALTRREYEDRLRSIYPGGAGRRDAKRPPLDARTRNSRRGGHKKRLMASAAVLGLGAVMLMAAVLIATDAFGWYDFNRPVLTPSSRSWNCTDYGGIDVRGGGGGADFCGELKKAAEGWNAVSGGDFYLGYMTAPTTDIHVRGADPSDLMVLALATQALHNGVLAGGDIERDASTHCLADSSKPGADTSCYDIQSVAAHEFGRLQWVGHYILNSGSITQDNPSPHTEGRILGQHDIDVLRARH